MARVSDARITQIIPCGSECGGNYFKTHIKPGGNLFRKTTFIHSGRLMLRGTLLFAAYRYVARSDQRGKSVPDGINGILGETSMRPLAVKLFGENVLQPARGLPLMTALVSFVSICVILYFGRDILVPIVLAILLSILLVPVVRFLQRLSIPRSLAITAVVAVTFTGIILGTAVLATTLTRLAADLPSYETNLREKARSIKLFASGGGTIEKAANVLKDLQSELVDSNQPSTGKPKEVKPIPVELRNSNFGPLQPIVSVISFIIHPITQFGIVILMVFFILFNREDLRNRMVRLAGTGDINRTTIAIDEAGRRLTHLFSAQLLVNILTGTIIGTGLTIIGVPGGILWGVLTAVLRFIPYVGTMLSSIFPVIIAAAIGDGWTLAIITAALVFVSELIVGQVIEPLLFGKMTGLSPVAIVASATFWTALWGPIGLVLATPIMIGVLVLGRHIEALNFLEILLGSQPVLTPDHAFYQRLLAGDSIEAAELAADYDKDERLEAFLSEVAVPALLLAHNDQQRKLLDRPRQTAVANTFSETLDEIWGDDQSAASEKASVLLISAHGPLNFSATLAFSALLKNHHIAHRMLPEDAILPGHLPAIDASTVSTICLCYLSAPSEAQKNYAVRRITQQANNARLLTIAWSGAEGHGDIHIPAHAMPLLQTMQPQAGVAEAAGLDVSAAGAK